MKWIGTVAAAIAMLALAGPAFGDVLDDNPAAASRQPGDVYVFARGGDGQTYERHWTGSAFSDWSPLGGQASSGPGAAAYGANMNVFVRGTDDALWQDALINGAWSGWHSLGGTLTSAPAAIARRGTPYFDVVARGADNQIYHRFYSPSSGWSGWETIGGEATSAPTVVSHATGVVDVFVRGTDRGIYQKSWDGSKWGDWIALGGVASSAPVAITAAAGTVDLFVRGTDDTVFQKHYSPSSGWTGWQRLDGTKVDSGVGAVADGEAAIDLFARYQGGLAYKFQRASWGPWTPWGPVAPPAPPPAPAPDGQLRLNAGIRCTPPGGGLKVNIKVRHRKGHHNPRVKKVRFFVKHGPHRTDHKRPYVVRLQIDRPAGSKGRVFATVYFKRSKHGKLRHKTVSRRFVMCG
jgi:hypothetical protein